MFFFFGGTRIRRKRLGEGHFHCPNCDRAQSFDRVQRGNWVHLYWIPLFRTQDLGEAVVCRGCGSEFADVQGTRPTEDGGGTPGGGAATWPCPTCGNVNPTASRRCLGCGEAR